METFHSDAAWVQACIEGQLSAFEELVKRHQDTLYRNALGYVHQPEEAQDIVQEAFLKAFQELPNLDDPAKFGSWVKSITRNACLNALRSHRRAVVAQEKMERELLETNRDTSSVEDREMASVHDLLSRLPEESARAFIMHYIEDLPIKSIARQLGSSPQSIKQRLFRARQQLQKEVLKMVKDNIDKEKLPDDFPERVVAHLLERGRKDRLYMRYNEARAQFQDALEAAPENPEAMLELGRTYDPIGWPNRKDVEVLERAAVAAPNAIEVACELESAYRQPGYEQEHPQARQKCLGLCEARLVENAKDARALKAMARVQVGTGHFAKAEELLQMVVEESPEDQEAHYYLARTLNRQQQYEHASRLYEKTYTLNSKTVWAYFALRELSTHLAFRKGEGEKAVQMMEEVWALTQRPNEAGNLIYFYSISGQLQKALDVFEAVKTLRHHPRVYATVGLACMEKGDFDRAEEMLKLVVESTRDSGLRAEVQIHLARVMFALDKPDEARRTLENGLSLDLNQRIGLAQKKTSAFWPSWTKWLAETLEDMQQKDARVKPLLQVVRESLDQIPG